MPQNVAFTVNMATINVSDFIQFQYIDEFSEYKLKDKSDIFLAYQIADKTVSAESYLKRKTSFIQKKKNKVIDLCLKELTGP